MIYYKKAFTLLELMVWIAIISIISLWISNLYWSNIPDKQRLDIFTNKVISIIDSVKNYALVWKWIWQYIETPKYYKIDISTGSYLRTYYNTWIIDTLFYPLSIDTFTSSYSIKSITCKNLDLTNLSTTNAISIFYEWSTISLSWCIDNYQKIVDIELFFKWFTNIIRLNSISWVLEEIKKQ